MATVTEVRHANLLSLIAWAGSIQKLADLLEKSHSQLSQLRNQIAHSTTGKPRVIGDGLAREIEATIGVAPGWMDSPQGPPPVSFEELVRLKAAGLPPQMASGNIPTRQKQMAHGLSYQADTVHSLSWEELMTMSGDVESGRAELPSRFWVTLGDDAMGPRAAAGTKMLFVTSEAPRYGDAVLLLGPDGAFHVRQYGQSLSYGFEARPTNPAYEAFHGDMPGVKVVAVMRGIEKPFDQIA